MLTWLSGTYETAGDSDDASANINSNAHGVFKRPSIINFAIQLQFL